MHMTNSISQRPLSVSGTVYNPAEQKLKLADRGKWLMSMADLCQHDAAAKASFEQDAENLRRIYKGMKSESTIRQNCERLAKLRDELGLRVVDNRQAYLRRAAGGAV